MSNAFSNMKIFPIKNNEWIKGHGSVLVGGVVEVKFTVRSGSKGVFASLPATPGKKTDDNGKKIYYPDVKIPNKDLYFEFQKLVQAEYQKAIGEESSSQSKQGEESSSQSKQGEESQVDSVPF